MAKNSNYISAKESRRISRENRKITSEIEKKRNRNAVSPSQEDSVKVIVDAINAAGGCLPIAQIRSLPLTKHQLDVALEQLRSEGRLVIKGSKVALVN